MGRVHHPGIKERGIAPLQLPSYHRPSGLDPSSLAATPFRGNGSQRLLERGLMTLGDAIRLTALVQTLDELHSMTPAEIRAYLGLPLSPGDLGSRATPRSHQSAEE